jgi:hypothetical protein
MKLDPRREALDLIERSLLRALEAVGSRHGVAVESQR